MGVPSPHRLHGAVPLNELGGCGVEGFRGQQVEERGGVKRREARYVNLEAIRRYATAVMSETTAITDACRVDGKWNCVACSPELQPVGDAVVAKHVDKSRYHSVQRLEVLAYSYR